jgi:hypothetical protein
VEVIDDLVVHRPAKLRMRMQDDCDRGVFGFLGMVTAFETAFRSWKNYFGHFLAAAPAGQSPETDALQLTACGIESRTILN